MKDTGETKGIDAVGKIMIPKDIRNQLGIDPGDKLHFYVGEGLFRGGKDTIIIKKEAPMNPDDFNEDVYGI